LGMCVPYHRATRACIPKRIFIIVTFTGDVADLVAMGVRFTSIFPGEGENDFAIGEGYIDPTRLVDLAAMPHVLGIRGSPDVQPVLSLWLPGCPGGLHPARASAAVTAGPWWPPSARASPTATARQWPP